MPITGAPMRLISGVSRISPMTNVVVELDGVGAVEDPDDDVHDEQRHRHEVQVSRRRDP